MCRKVVPQTPRKKIPPGIMHSFIAISCLLGVAMAAPSGVPLAGVAAIESVSVPRYGFNYAVNDPTTGDNKAQSETRDGGLVRGSYSLAEPDGTLRIVEYTADSLSGFNAVVKRVGPAVHPQVVPVRQIEAPVAVAAPVAVTAPVATSVIGFGGLGHGIGNLGIGNNGIGDYAIGNYGIGNHGIGNIGLRPTGLDLVGPGYGLDGIGSNSIGALESLGWKH